MRPIIRRPPLLLAVLSAIIFSVAVSPVGAEPRTKLVLSVIGDYDCFGYGSAVFKPNPTSPCGTLPGFPIHENDDAANTDITLACPGPSIIALTNTYTLPPGTILGAVWQMNVGGIETSKFSSKVLLGGVVPVNLPDTGPLGTALIVVPLVPPLTTILEEGQLTVQLIRGNADGSICDDVFVDNVGLAIAVQP